MSNEAAEHAAEMFRSLGVEVGSVIDGKFRVEQLIGVGGMSYVLRALHVELDEPVALKCLSPQWLNSADVAERFSREARAAVKLKSDHVARVFDVGKLPGGIPYMVMEYLEGHDIGRLLDTQQVISIAECVGWMIEACSGLAEAHARGIVHRDVKPENLFIVRRPDGRTTMKLLDFGISKLLVGPDLELDRTRGLLGTPLYMSPEQVRASRDLDQRTDIWSLGAVFYEVLSGRSPFSGSSVTEVCAQILEHVPEPPSTHCANVPSELSAIVLRCLEKDPAARYANVAELALELVAFAPPVYHAHVDRIVSTLQVAGAPRVRSSRPNPTHVAIRFSHSALHDDPAVDDTIPTLPPPRSFVSTGAAAVTNAVRDRAKRRTLYAALFGAALAGIVMLGFVRPWSAPPPAAGAASAAAPAPLAAPAAPRAAEPVASAAPSAPALHPVAAAVSSSAPSAPSAIGVDAGAVRASKKSRPVRPAASARAAEPSEPAKAAPVQPRLDIELSR